MLVFIAGLQQGQRYAIKRDQVRMGRERFNDLTIDDEGASRAHAEIRRRGGGLYLRDLGSTNGTYVNNRKVTEVRLANGDRIAIGATIMLVEMPRETPSAPLPQSVHFHDGDPAEVTTQFRLDPRHSDLLIPARARADARGQESFQRLYRFTVRISSQLTVEALLEAVMEEIFEAAGADRGFVLLVEEGGTLKTTAVRLRRERATVAAAAEIAVSKKLSRHVLEKGESLMLTETQSDRRFADTTAFGAGTVKSVIAAPLKAQDRVLGLVYLDTLADGRLFTQTDLELVTAMAAGAAAALENARLYEKLMDATEYSAAILRSLSSGLLVADAHLVLRKVNRTALTMLGVEEMELAGRKMSEIPALARVAQAVSEALEAGRPAEGLETGLLVSGREVPVEVSVSFMTDHTGMVTGTVANFRDLTQVRKLAEQVKHQEQLAALGEMAAGVAHEIRNPLNSIRGFAQLMLEHRPAGEVAPSAPPGSAGGSETDYLKIIIEEVDRMNGIVQDLLDYSRQQSITMAKVPVTELVRAVLEQLAAEAASLHVEVVTEVPPDMPLAYGNETKLRQVFLNIAKNSLEAMAAGGGKLAVSLRAAPEAPDGAGRREIAVAFTDTGIGIPPEVLPRIFDPFFTTKDVGTGLGLAICSKIVDAHGGRIEVQSEAGRGTTFTVLLPAPRSGDTDRFPAIQ